MEATIVIVLFLAVIGGGMLLMLAAGYQSAEKERAQRAASRQPAAVTDVTVIAAEPGFMTAAGPPIAALPFAFDDALLSQLEHHVQIEQAAVARFVHHPSIDNLYRSPGAAYHVH